MQGTADATRAFQRSLFSWLHPGAAQQGGVGHTCTMRGLAEPLCPPNLCLRGIPLPQPAWLPGGSKAQSNPCLWALVFSAALTDKRAWLWHPIKQPVKITIETIFCTCYNWK